MIAARSSDGFYVRGSAIDNCVGAAFKTVQLALLCMQSVSAALSTKDESISGDKNEEESNPPINSPPEDAAEEESPESEIPPICKIALKRPPPEFPCTHCLVALSIFIGDSIDLPNENKLMVIEGISTAFSMSHMRSMLEDLKGFRKTTLFEHNRFETDEDYNEIISVLDARNEEYFIIPSRIAGVSKILEKLQEKYKIEKRPLGIYFGHPFANPEEFYSLYCDTTDANAVAGNK